MASLAIVRSGASAVGRCRERSPTTPCSLIRAAQEPVGTSPYPPGTPGEPTREATELWLAKKGSWLEMRLRTGTDGVASAA